MKGSTIGPLNNNPNGRFLEGIILGTPLPGTIMEMDATVAPVNGRFSYRASGRTAGKDRAPMVLLEDSDQGFLVTTAYVSGTRGFLYVAIPGDELNVLVDVPGTGTGAKGGVQQGEYLEYQGNGHLTLETGSPEGTSWQSQENVADVNPAVAQLCWAMYIG